MHGQRCTALIALQPVRNIHKRFVFSCTLGTLLQNKLAIYAYDDKVQSHKSSLVQVIAVTMAPCTPRHSSAHAVLGATPGLSKAIKRTFHLRAGLGNGLGSGSRRYIGLPFRTRDQENAMFEAVPAEQPSMLMSIIDLTQAFSIFMVMGIQVGLIVRKHTAVASKPTMTVSQETATPNDRLLSLVEHQPFFLAWGLACALCARLFSPRWCAPPALTSVAQIFSVGGLHQTMQPSAAKFPLIFVSQFLLLWGFIVFDLLAC